MAQPWSGFSHDLDADTVLRLKKAMFGDAGIEFSDARGQNLHNAEADFWRYRQNIQEYRLRHHAHARRIQNGDIGGAALIIDGSNFADEIIGAHVTENDFLASGDAQDHPGTSGQQKPHILRIVFKINDQFVFMVVPPKAPGGIAHHLLLTQAFKQVKLVQ